MGERWGLTFGVTVLKGDSPLVLGGEAAPAGEAEGAAGLGLVGAAGTRLAGLEAIG